MITLKELRKQKRLSLRELSKLSGVGLATLVRLEAGKFNARLSTQRKLSKALKVGVDKLQQGRKTMVLTKKHVDWEREATEVSREVKDDFWGVWRKHKPRLKDSLLAHDFEELELIFRQFQLKLRNQQTPGY